MVAGGVVNIRTSSDKEFPAKVLNENSVKVHSYDEITYSRLALNRLLPVGKVDAVSL